ncbi:MAG: class I adenylate-forming enzyme family protein [Halobacteria archaeon]
MEYLGDQPLRNVGEIPVMAARRYGDKRAILDSSQELSFTELDEKSNSFANVLTNSGLEKGERVGIYLPNTVRFPEAFFGVVKAGGVPVPLNLRMDTDTLSYVIGNSGIDRIVSSPLLLGGVEVKEATVAAPTEVAEASGADELYLEGGVTEDVKTRNYGDLVQAAEDEFELVDRGYSDTAMQPYTSGTTGRPKGVLLSHLNVLTSLESFTKSGPSLDPDNTLLLVLPLFHVYGLNALMLMYLYNGGEVVLQTIPEPVSILKNIDEYGVSEFPAVPAIFEMVYRTYRENMGEYDLSTLEMVGSAAAPLSDSTEEKINEGWNVEVGEGWAMTETSASGTVQRQCGIWKSSGCVGKPVYGIELRIVDQDSGEVLVETEELEPGSRYTGGEVEGEIQVRGPQVFEGYHDMPERTDEVFTEDGWFRTGDIARVDSDGDLWIAGRMDDMILTGGNNVYPAEVEDALLTHQNVVEAGVAKAPHEIKGNAPVAFVVTDDNNEGEPVNEEQLREYALERVPSYAHPRRIFFIEELPRSATEKIQRYRLEEMAERRIDGKLGKDA